MQCSNCNSEVKKGEKKCAKCGATLIWNVSKKEPKKEVNKRPISIIFILLIGILFLIVLLVSILPFEKEIFINSISFVFVLFSPIFLIVSFILIFRNKGKNTRRMLGFMITTFATFAILISAIAIFTNSVNHFFLANKLFESKEYEDAIFQYEIVIEENKDPEQVAYSIQKVEEADNFIEEAKENVEKGDVYYSNTQYKLALVEYETAKDIYPYLSGLNNKISDCENKRDEQRAAETQKEEKIKGLLGQGKGLFQTKKYEEALNKYNEVLKIETSNKEAKEKISEIEDIINEVEKLLAEGDRLFNFNRYEAALSKYQDAENLYPNHPEVADRIRLAKQTLGKKIELAEKDTPREEIAEVDEVETDDTSSSDIKVEDWKASILDVNEDMYYALKYYSEDLRDFKDGIISLSSFKEYLGGYIDEINDYYIDYLKIEPPNNEYKKVHEIFGNAIEHFAKNTINWQGFIDAETEDGLIYWMEKSYSEMNEGFKDMEDTNEELKKIKE